MIRLADRAANTDRYKNRGGKLLQEERDRNKVLKQIPKIEEEIKYHVANHYMSTGNHLLLWGQRVDEIIDNTNEDFKEQQRQKLDARKQQREKTLTPGKTSTFGMSLAPSMQNLATSSGVKRNLATPVSAPAKRTKIVRTAPPKLHMAPPPKVCVNSRTMLRYSIGKVKRMQRIRRSVETSTDTNTTNTDYEDFQVRLKLAQKYQKGNTTFDLLIVWMILAHCTMRNLAFL